MRQLVGLTCFCNGVQGGWVVAQGIVQHRQRVLSQAKTPDSCEMLVNRSIDPADRVTCDHATWTVGGQQQTGTLTAQYRHVVHGGSPACTAVTCRSRSVHGRRYVISMSNPASSATMEEKRMATPDPDPSQANPALSRRGVLASGGGMIAALALGTSSPAEAAPAGAVALPDPGRFDLYDAATDLFRHKPLHEPTVMQSFAFDNVNRRLFAAQVRGTSGAAARGDLCVTRLTFAGDRIQGQWMHLNGFGHAVSFGVEPRGTESHLWIEVDPEQVNGSARGQRLTRVRFQAGKTISGTKDLPRYTLIPDAEKARQLTCSIDPVYGNIAVRYHTPSGGFRFAVYVLPLFSQGIFVRLADIATPSGLGVFQGYALYGRYLYLYAGEAYSGDNQPPGNTYMSCVDLATGREVSRFLSRAGRTLSHREPEGLAIYRTRAGEMRLFQGIASGPVGDRRANLFFKNKLIRATPGSAKNHG
ncbi:hypothetical protein [Actinomadura sp. 9N407]|uniref:phage baseplate protein n=1 Tax=Actinomadura sp. 9N407 TaxID=3375154 RepID=UPI003792603A